MLRCCLLLVVLGGVIGVFGVGAAHADAGPARRLWKPVRDDVYLQEVGRQVETARPVLALAVYEGRLYAGFEEGLRTLEGDAFEDVAFAKTAVRRLKALGGALWVVSDEGLHRIDGKGVTAIAQGEFRDVCLHGGAVVAATGEGLLRVVGDTLEAIPNAGECPGGIQRIASYAETVYCLTPGRLALFDGERYDNVNTVDWGRLESTETRDMLALGSRLYIATDVGLAQLRGMAMTSIRGQDGLCYEDTVCLAEGFEDDLWIATSRGAIRAVGVEYHYFAAPRWLPDIRVRAIACGDRVAYVGTDAGVGIIEYEPFTLQKKAAYYARHLEEWGQKRLGFTHKLEWDPAIGGWVREVSDNDGGWSCHYLAAMCFKYAATGDEAARAEAVNSFNSLKWLEEMTPIAGFPARSVWAKGETGHKAQGGSGGYAAEWHDTDDGAWEWKGDTSSDETDAHFYATAIFHDLVAEGEEKARAKEHLARLAAHIVDNGWVLRDRDGKPTVWGRWDPEYFSSLRGFFARGLNGLEALSYMKTAHALTGEAKFDAAYRQLLDWGYHTPVLRQKLTFPPDAVFHSDDRLAFFAYYTILQYETDPELRSVYRRSFERSWEVERIEHIPWFSFIYGALTGNDCEAGEAVKHLREWPLDLINHSFQNSHRHDLATRPGYVPYSGGTRALSPREIGPLRWSSDTLRYDGGSAGHEVVDPAGWLDAYWMGRYYGFITAPATDDPELTTVQRRGLELGAKTYDGPPRP